MSFYDHDELTKWGFRKLGSNVLISRRASFHGIQRISIGNNVRIDDFCVLSAGEEGISIGSHVHIAVFVSLIGAAKITIGDFAGLSGRSSIYSSSDDFSGHFLTGPTVPPNYTNVISRPVNIGRHAVVGAGAVVLPGVSIAEGAAIGALSVVNRDCDPFIIYAGTPARPLKSRDRHLLDLEMSLRASEPTNPNQ
jgi:acetyltransferase-like isoleucine patch superfamily enzyme